MKKVLYIVLELTLEFYILFDSLPSHFYQVQLVLETGKYHLYKGHEHCSGHIICKFLKTKTNYQSFASVS